MTRTPTIGTARAADSNFREAVKKLVREGAPRETANKITATTLRKIADNADQTTVATAVIEMIKKFFDPLK